VRLCFTIKSSPAYWKKRRIHLSKYGKKVVGTQFIKPHADVVDFPLLKSMAKHVYTPLA